MRSLCFSDLQMPGESPDITSGRMLGQSIYCRSGARECRNNSPRQKVRNETGWNFYRDGWKSPIVIRDVQNRDTRDTIRSVIGRFFPPGKTRMFSWQRQIDCENACLAEILLGGERFSRWFLDWNHRKDSKLPAQEFPRQIVLNKAITFYLVGLHRFEETFVGGNRKQS